MVAVPRHLGRRAAVRFALREICRVVPQMAEARPASSTLLRLQQVLIWSARRLRTCAKILSSLPLGVEKEAPRCSYTDVPFDPNFIARLIPALLEGAEVRVELA